MGPSCELMLLYFKNKREMHKFKSTTKRIEAHHVYIRKPSTNSNSTESWTY